MNVQGKIKVIGATESIGAKGFLKRLLVIETAEQYPQSLPIEFTQDKTSLLDNFNIGDDANVSINLRGSEWQGKYYANIQGWRIEKSESEKKSQRTPPFDGKEPINNALQQEEELDSLPF
jgi:hypothetical protein